jgi:twitching motility protein PilT
LSLKEQFRQVALTHQLLDADQVELAWDFYMFEGRKRHPADVAVSLGFLAQDRAHLLRDQVNASQSQMRARRAEEREVARASPKASPSAAPRPPTRAQPRVRRSSPTGERPATPGLARAQQAAAARSSGSLQELVRQAIKAEASDLYLHSGTVPFVRASAQIKELDAPALEGLQLKDELQELLSPQQWETLLQQGEVNLCLTFEGGYRLRLNVFQASHGVCASMRLVPPQARNLRQLNLPQSAAALMNHHQGLVLVAGPASSGKSATLSALLMYLSAMRSLHIITIEDPIEMVYEPQRSTITQRNVGLHTRSYHTALKAALREDPDVIVIGEMQDVETIRIALEAAETGHLVIGTMHAWNVEGALSRLMDAFGEEEEQMRGLIADAVRGLLVQQLVRTTRGELFPVVELAFNNSAIAHCIRKRKLHQIQSLMHSGKGQKMITLEDSLRELRQRRMLSARDEARLLAELRRLSD